ncbi:hypothetical protein F5Y16DRAFT_398223 [Xylariaceae sp. FL0255]|nr:hypothetical protein F5Y16DRAFT_398223 [Xylariaceae sp. FL0255]
MDQFRKRTLVHALSRQSSARNSDDTIPTRLETISGDLASYDSTDEITNEKGPLGLTTLHEPLGSQAIADIVFIHGLGGGSRKSWSKTPSHFHFWPKTWLPEDPDFENVRIHSFGYKADWGERRHSILNIHDFAQSLLGEMKNNPSIRRDNTKLILVGHSMGGCVAKKAYILACQDISCRDIASRITAMFFLGTPHRGSDLASILQNMLTIAWGTKPYVSDLLPNSTTLAEINDAFRHYAKDLQLWSFYETLPVRTKVLNKLIVEKYSATLGYNNEEISGVDADHRHICKFDNNADPNYKKLRNALCTAIEMIKPEAIQNTPLEAFTQIESLLEITETSFEDDLVSLQELRHPGSCAWFTEQPCISSWMDAESQTSPILWLTGRPATGKSVLSGYMIDHLKTRKLFISYFFFKHGKQGRSTLSNCFLGLAYQMAKQDNTVLQMLLQIGKEGDQWDRQDERSIWRKVFVQRLFRLQTISDHIWVIDGFDECSKSSSWFKLASNLPEKEDMRVYVTDRLDELSLGNIGELCHTILTKSQGSFLWVRLVLQELENAYTDEDIEDILNEIPSDLQELYHRMLRSIENERRRTKLAKSILKWVVLACRPLSVDELRCAIKLDIHETPHNMEKVISTVCGQLVFVDQGAKVHMIHETAREFLVSEDLVSDLAVRKGDGHGQLALVCCRYLSGEVLKVPPDSKATRASKLFSAMDTALVDYASRYFTEHLYRSNSKDDAPMDELILFLRSNTLHWVEKAASSGDLSLVTRSAVNLTGYLRRRAKYVPPVNSNMQIIEGWATDLTRVCAKFRSKLLVCPSSIHCLVPPLCPIDTTISKTFTTPTRSLMVRGAVEHDWDDCLARIDFRKGQTTVSCYGRSYFAIGLSSGQISIYDAQFIQNVSLLRHPERVKLMDFSANDEYLASGGQKHICVWATTTGAAVWSWSLEFQSLALSFTGLETLTHIDKGSRLVVRNFESGETSITHWDPGTRVSDGPLQQPSKSAISHDLGIFAVAYRSHPIQIFDLDNAAYLGQCMSMTGNGVDAMAFSSNTDSASLIVLNGAGELLVFDPVTTELKCHRPGVYAHVLSSPEEGAILVTGNSHGTIEVHEFGGYESRSLTLIYRINASDEGIRSVGLSKDGLRIIGCHGSQACVWEPAILAQKDAEGASQSDISSQVTIPLKSFGATNEADDAQITVMACHNNDQYVLCGNSIGEVRFFSIVDGQRSPVIYNHSKSVAVIAAAIAPDGQLLVTADESGRVLVGRLRPNKSLWPDVEIIIDRRYNGTISSMLLNPAGDRLLLLGQDGYEVWVLPSGSILKSRNAIHEGLPTAINHPMDDKILVMLSSAISRIFKWLDFEELIDQRGIPLHRTSQWTMSEVLTHQTYNSTSVIVEVLKFTRAGGRTQLHCWNPSSFKAESQTSLSGTSYELLNPHIRSIIAVVGLILVFIDVDMWVCSLDLGTFSQAPYAKRHFFILSEWLDVNGEVICALTSGHNFVFVNRGGIVVISHGLEFSETITLSPQQGWVGHSGSMHRRTSSSIASSTSLANRTR